MADKYGKPAVKKCSDFLLAAIRKQDESNASLDALLKEPTDGLVSSALKAALVAELFKTLSDNANTPEFHKEFKAACDTVAGDILINMARDARRIGSRGVSK
jgi:hypothetical protein